MTDKPLSKTAALKAAQAACGSIYRRSNTDYVCTVPLRDDDPHGTRTEIQAYDFWRCRSARSRMVANIALALMGYERTPRDDYQVEAEIEAAINYHHETTAKGIVERVIANMEAKPCE